MKFRDVKISWSWIMQLVIVLLAVAGLKYYYANASVNELRWILAPTTFLVELATGESFRFEAFAGYMNSDSSFVIAAACSGVNFLMTSFLMVALIKLWRCGFEKVSWTFLPYAILTAYVTTVAANAVRISTALGMRGLSLEATGLSPEEIHRIEGIYVYFGFLFLQFILTETANRGSAARKSSLFQRSLVPLLVYWAMTLVVPLANGAFLKGTAFWEHTLFVLLVPILLLLPLGGWYLVRDSAFVRFGPVLCQKLFHF